MLLTRTRKQIQTRTRSLIKARTGERANTYPKDARTRTHAHADAHSHARTQKEHTHVRRHRDIIGRILGAKGSSKQRTHSLYHEYIISGQTRRPSRRVLDGHARFSARFKASVQKKLLKKNDKLVVH